MTRPRSELLGSLGKLFEIFKTIADKVLELGGSDEDITRIGTDEKLAEDIATLICGKESLLKWVQGRYFEARVCGNEVFALKDHHLSITVCVGDILEIEMVMTGKVVVIGLRLDDEERYPSDDPAGNLYLIASNDPHPEWVSGQYLRKEGEKIISYGYCE